MSEPGASAPIVRWGVLGTGAVASAFAEGLHFVEGARLEAVGSRQRASAEHFAARYGAARAFGSYEELVADNAVDVVYVATTNELHREHSLLAIAAGRSVLCEKPFALDAAEGREIVAAARHADVFCMEAMWMRCSPVVRETIGLARSGALGELRLLSAQLGFPHDVDPTSRLFSPVGGGALLDLGVYPISLAHAIFGSPGRIAASAVLTDLGVDEQVSVILDYAGGSQAVIAAGLRSSLTNAATLFGTAGTLAIDEPIIFPHRYRVTSVHPAGPVTRAARGRLASLRHTRWVRLLAEQRKRLHTRTHVRREPGNGYSSEAAEVMRCLRAGLKESPDMPLDESLEVLATLDAIRAGWSTGR